MKKIARINTDQPIESFEGITIKRFRLEESECSQAQLTNNPRLHISHAVLKIIEKLPREFNVPVVDFVKIDFDDERYDSEIFAKSKKTALPFESFVALLIHMIDESFSKPDCVLHTHGTRDDPPMNVFIVLHNKRLHSFTLVQDRNSDGNTFKDWFLGYQVVGNMKLSPSNSVMFALS